MTPKPRYLFALAAAALMLSVAGPTASRGQASDDADSVGKLVEEVAAQQTKIVENQTALDEKIAAVAEEVRQARIFVARGGAHK